MKHPKRKLGALLCLAVFGLPIDGFAQSDTPGASFKRVRVGDAPSGDLINIQIDPDAPIAPETAPSPELGAKRTGPPADLQDWFWSKLSPDITAASASRMAAAVDQMQAAPPAFNVNLAHMRKLAGLYGRDIVIGSLGTDVSPALILAMIAVESSGRVDAESSAGAQGLMQLIPATAERFGVTDPLDPVQNIQGGSKYMSWLLKEFENDPLLALAAYNAGENAVKSRGSVPDFPETRAYVPKVVAAWQVAAGLCQSPPKYVWEGCAFTVPPLAKVAKE